MNSRFLLFLVVSGFMVLSLSAALTADKESRLTYYQREVKGKETGIYSHNGDLYVHVKLPYREGDRSDLKRAEATRMTREMLRNWAISYAEERQREKSPESDGIKFTKSLVGKYYPQWNYGSWMFRGATQIPVPDTSNGYYVGGLIASEQEVISQIPDGFYQHGSVEDLFKGVRIVVRANSLKGGSRFFRECGIVDFPGVEAPDDPEVMREEESVDDKIADYVADSQMCRRMKASIDMLSTPVLSEARDTVVDATTSVTNEVSVISTNYYDQVVVSTNVEVRAQEIAEVKKTGYSEGAKVAETVCVSNEFEIIETVTRTIVATTRKTARHMSKSVVGMPTFENVFFNGFTNGTTAAETTRFGEIAMSRISGGSSAAKTGGLLKSALQENPYDKTLWNAYGKWLSGTNDCIGSVICFRRAVALDPRCDQSLINLAKAYRDIGCSRLCNGLAFVVCGLSDDEYVKNEAESILCGR